MTSKKKARGKERKLRKAEANGTEEVAKLKAELKDVMETNLDKAIAKQRLGMSCQHGWDFEQPESAVTFPLSKIIDHTFQGNILQEKTIDAALMATFFCLDKFLQNPDDRKSLILLYAARGAESFRSSDTSELQESVRDLAGAESSWEEVFLKASREGRRC